MIYKPIWTIKSKNTAYPRLEENLNIDIAIIGGGITGITTAYLLTQEGKKVALFEKHKIGKGTTGQSTGNLYDIIEYPLHQIEKKYDENTLQKVIESRKATITFIEDIINNLKIDCDFIRQPMYIFGKDSSIEIGKEQTTAEKINLDFSSLNTKDFPFPVDKGIMLDHQAQLNPLKYVQELAHHTFDKGCKLFENTPITEIKKEADIIKLKTQYAEVKAQKVVYATHTPLGLQIQYHTTLGPYREYGIAAKLENDTYPEGIYWGYYNNKKISIRTYNPDGDPYLICVGAVHKVGHTKNNNGNILELIDYLKTHFNIQKITHQWGGQNYKPADLLPYIGQKNKNSNEYIATGFSTDGLVYGSLSAQILTGEISGNPNVYKEIYKAYRHQPLKAGKRFIKENIDVAKQLIGDAAKEGLKMKANDLSPNQGKIIQLKEGKYAVYKTTQRDLKILSPICPHMGCTVHWNDIEKTWACPCHGSRFNTDGSVIEGPSLKDLK